MLVVDVMLAIVTTVATVMVGTTVAGVGAIKVVAATTVAGVVPSVADAAISD